MIFKVSSTKHTVTMATKLSKHIGSIPELLRCHTILVVTLNLMHIQIFRLIRKSRSLLDDSRTFTLLLSIINSYVIVQQ